MEAKDLSALKECPLFIGIEVGEISALLGCLGARERRHARGETVFEMGAPARYLGVVLWGSVHVEQTDYWGNRAILTDVGS